MRSTGDSVSEKMQVVSYYACNCADSYWNTKYCDEHHRAYARIPVSVLEQYTYRVGEDT